MEKAIRPNYGISRIDQPEKRNHGFYVRISFGGQQHSKYFPDKSNGGKDIALVNAQKFRDSIISNLPLDRQKRATSPSRAIPKSGVVGVTHLSTKRGDYEYTYWQGAWTLPDGRRRTKKFSIKYYGNREALRLAIKVRKNALADGMLP